jgi:integrase
MSKVYQRGHVWYVDYSFNGQRVRKKVGTSKKMAEAVLKDVEVKKIKGEFLGVTELKKVVFEKLCAEYLEYSKANKTKESYVRDITSLNALSKKFKGIMVSMISAWDLEQYKNMRVKKVTPSSVNRELAFIKHMFNKAVEWGYLTSNQLRSVKLFKEPPGRIRYVTEEEEIKLLDYCSENTKDIVLFALNTGMRRSEIFNLKWSDVDFRQRNIIVRRSKNNEYRVIPMHSSVVSILKRLHKKASSIYVFEGKNGKLTTVKTGFNKAVRKAGIKDLRFHDLRHTFASRLVMNGVDIASVKKLMGHKDIKMTMRYSHLSDDHLKEAVRKLEIGTDLAQTAQQKSVLFAKR